MKVQEFTNFEYRNEKLFCEDVSIEKLAEEFGTPLYVYSKKYFSDRYKAFTNAFQDIDHQIFYAVKSNFNLSVINTFAQLGAGVDVNSEGELFRALKLKIKPEKIIFSGVGKTKSEIKIGLMHDLLMLKAESEEEIVLINDIAKELNKTARVAIRVNPNVNPLTHAYISTGLAENKFGIDLENALRIYKTNFSNVVFTGIDMHLGSQIMSIDPYIEAVEKLSEIVYKLKEVGIYLHHFDLGGGMGVRYKDEDPFTIQEYANKLIPMLKKLDCKIFFEPGRYLTGNGGILVTEILYKKKNEIKDFYIVDAAINDLIRPSFYGAYHHIQPVDITNKDKEIVVDVVGPVCESGDYLAKQRNVLECNTGDKLAVYSTGSYTSVMSSNYNGRRRAAEVLVDGTEYKVVRSRETFDHLIWDEEKQLK